MSLDEVPEVFTGAKPALEEAGCGAMGVAPAVGAFEDALGCGLLERLRGCTAAAGWVGGGAGGDTGSKPAGVGTSNCLTEGERLRFLGGTDAEREMRGAGAGAGGGPGG